MTYEPFEKVPDPRAKQGEAFERLDPGADYEQTTQEGTPDPRPGVETDGEKATKAMGDAFSTIYDRLRNNIALSTTKFVDDVSSSPALRALWRAGGTALDYLDRAQGALVAGQRILISEIKGENTADMLTPWEILAKYDLRGVTDLEREQYQRAVEEWEELSPQDKLIVPKPEKPGRPITARGGDEGIPGQKELLQTALGEEKVELLESSPFMIGNKPMTKDNIWRLLTMRKLIGTTPDAESDVILTQGEFLRGVMNVVNDPLVPLEFVAMPAKGVRGVRHYLVDPNYQKIATNVDRRVADALENVDQRATELMRFDNALIEAETIDDMIDVTRDIFQRYETGQMNSPDIFRALSLKIGQLQPNSQDTDLIELGRWFADIDMKLSDFRGTARLETETGQRGTDFAEGLSALKGDPYYQEFISRTQNFISRLSKEDKDKLNEGLRRTIYNEQYYEDTGRMPLAFLDLTGAYVGDAYHPGSLVERPTLMTRKGEIVFVQTTGDEVAGVRPTVEADVARVLEDDLELANEFMVPSQEGRRIFNVDSSVYPEYHRPTQSLYYMATGRKLEPGAFPDDAVTIRTFRTTDPDNARPTLIYEFRVPNAKEDDPMLREDMVDRIQEYLLNLGPGIQAQRNQNKIDARNYIQSQVDRAEERVYRSIGIVPGEDVPDSPLLQRRSILSKGRSLVRRFGSNVEHYNLNPRSPLAKKIENARKLEKAVNKAKEEAKKIASREAEARTSATEMDPRFYINIGHPDPKNADKRVRKLVEIDRGDITKMLSYNHSLRDIINLKAPVRAVAAKENPITAEITYQMKRGSQKNRLQPKVKLTDEEVENLPPWQAGLGDYTIMRALDEVDEAPSGSRMDDFISDAVKISADDVAEGRTSSIDKLEELADSRRNARHNADKHEPGGHSAPPRKSDPPSWIDEDSSAPFSIRDISFGWLRDPERVLTTSDDPTKDIYGVLTAAEYAQHRTRAAIANILTRQAPNIRRGSESSDRVGRVLMGLTKDANGDTIRLTAEEERGAVVIKELMDTLADSAGIPRSDNVRDYFTTLLQPTTGPKKRVPPELLDVPAYQGNKFYSHMLPTKRGRPSSAKESYDIVEAFRMFERAANREAHLEPAIKRAKELADELELPSARRRYLNTLTDRMRGKPTRYGRLWEEAVTNALENTGMVRVAERMGIDIDNPLTRTAGAITRGFYRGLLGGSIGFVVKNMTQSINTVADVGALNTLYGFSRMLTPRGNRSVREQELIRDFNNIFEDARFFETGLDSRNKVIRAGAQVMESIDDIIFKSVHFSEHINRGVAFHAGVAAEARKLGVSPNIVFGTTVENVDNLSQDVIRLLAAGHTVAQRTQFVYGALGRSPVFQTPLGRLSGQFLTYPIKQSEFLAETARKDPLGFVRWIAITGHWSRVLNDAGVDPTGFIGAGFMPQGVEEGVPIVLSPAFSSLYHIMRLSHSLARGDLPAAEREWNTVKKDMVHLMVPAALQVERTMKFADQYETYESTDPVTGALRRKLSDMEQFLTLVGLPSRESRISRDLAADIFKSQKREQFQRSNIISSMLDYVEERDKRIEEGETVPHLSHDDYYQRLVAQARAWGLPISSEQLNNAANSRELSTHLRRVLRDKKLAVEYWNRYLLAIPEEAKELGLEPIEPRR